MKAVILKGKQVVLRPLKVSDAKEFMPHVNDRNTTRYLSINPPISLKKEREFIKKSMKDWKMNNKFTWAITLKEDGKVIGAIDIHSFNKQHDRACIGIWIGRKYQRKGIGFNCARLVIDFAFKKLKLNRVEWRCLKPNIASRKLIEKLGGKKEGVLREESKKGKVRYDSIVYSILRREWK